MMKFKKTFFLILLIFLIGFGLRLFASLHYWIGGDEGNFLYDALLWNKGLFPFKDFLLGAPFLVFMIRFSTLIFGKHLFAGRIISVLLSSFTIVFIYLIGRRLWDEKIGLISALVFALSPFTVFWGSIIKTEPNVSFFISLAVFLAVVSYQDEKDYLFIFSGLVIGLASYVRLSAFVFEFVLLAFIAYFYLIKKRSIKSFFMTAAFVITGFVISYGLITYYLAAGSSFKAVIDGWSVAAVNVNPLTKNQNFNGGFLNDLMLKKAKVVGFIFQVSTEGAYLFIFPLVFIMLAFKRLFKNNYLRLSFIPIILFVYSFTMLKRLILLHRGFSIYNQIGVASIALLLISLLFILKDFKDEDLPSESAALIILWFVIPFLSLAFYGFQVMYYYEIALPSCFACGYLISKALSIKSKAFISSMFFALIVMLILPYFYYENTHGTSRYWSPGDISVVSNYLKKQKIGSSPEDVFLTGNTVVLYTNNLKSFGNISHPAVYFGETRTTDKKLKLQNQPTQPEILNALKSGKIRYFLMDKRTMGIYKGYPKILKSINENYFLLSEIDKRTKLYKHK